MAIRHGGRLGMLGHVGQRLGDHEVGGAFHGRRRTFGDVDGEVDRHRHPGDDRREGGVEAAVLEDRGMESPHQLAQFGQGRLGVPVGASYQLAGAFGVGVELLLGPPEVHGDRDQSLLSAVVQIALDALALLLAGVDRGDQLASSLVTVS